MLQHAKNKKMKYAFKNWLRKKTPEAEKILANHLIEKVKGLNIGDGVDIHR